MKQGWTYKKLNDCCEIEYGTRVVQKKDGGTVYPVYGGGGETFRMDRYNREDCLVVARFAMSKTCVRYVTGKFFLNDSGLSINAGDELLQSYLNHHIMYLNDDIYNLGKGAAQRNLDVNAFRKLTIAIPSLSVQQSIVAELDKINELIRLKKEQLSDYDKLAQSLFYEMFGDPVDNEKGWEVKKLGEVCEFYNGKAHENAIDEKGKYLLINSKFIASEGEIVKRTNEQMFPLYENDITMVMSDVPNGRALAKCFLVKSNDVYTLNQRICAFRNYSENKIYFHWVLNRNEYFLRFNDGNGQTNLRKNDILNCPIPLPPLPLQQTFAQRIELIEKQKAEIKSTITDLETLLTSRMQYWFE